MCLQLWKRLEWWKLECCQEKKIVPVNCVWLSTHLEHIVKKKKGTEKDLHVLRVGSKHPAPLPASPPGPSILLWCDRQTPTSLWCIARKVLVYSSCADVLVPSCSLLRIEAYATLSLSLSLSLLFSLFLFISLFLYFLSLWDCLCNARTFFFYIHILYYFGF